MLTSIVCHVKACSLSMQSILDKRSWKGHIYESASCDRLSPILVELNNNKIRADVKHDFI